MKRVLGFAPLLLAAVIAAAQWEPPQRTRIVALNIELDRVTGLFRVKTLDTIDWPEPLEQAAEEEFEAIESEIAADRVDDSPYPQRFFTIRALNAKDEVVFRAIDRLELNGGCKGLSQADQPRVAIEPPPPPRQVFFRIRVPLAGTESIEVRGWRPGHVARWTLEELREDPSIEKQDVFFRD